MLNKIKNLVSNYSAKEVAEKIVLELENNNAYTNIQSQIDEVRIQRHKIFSEISKVIGSGGKTILSAILRRDPAQITRFLSGEQKIPEEVMWRLHFCFGEVPLSCFLLESQMNKLNKNYESQENLENLVINNLNKLDINKDCPSFTEVVEVYFPTIIKRIYLDFQSYQQILGVRQNFKEIKFVISNDNLFSPDINKGDAVFFDLAHGKFTGDGVYLMAFDNTLLIRRVQKISTTQYRLSCNDARYSAIDHQATDLFFVGKVFGCLPSGDCKSIS